MEKEDFDRLLCNNPQHAVYKVDDVIYSDPTTGIRAIVGRRELPMSEGSRKAAPIPLDHYLIIEKPIRVPHSRLTRAFAQINESVKTEKRLPPRYRELLDQNLKLIDEMDAIKLPATGVSQESTMKLFESLKDRFYKNASEIDKIIADSPPIAQEGWSKRGPKADSHLKRRNDWIRRRVHVLYRTGLSYRKACWQTRLESKKQFPGKYLALTTIAKIAKVSLAPADQA